MIFSTNSKTSEIYILKNNKTHDFWQSYFASKLPKEKFDILCSDSINISELENSLISGLLSFTKDATILSEDHTLNHSIRYDFVKVVKMK